MVATFYKASAILGDGNGTVVIALTAAITSAFVNFASEAGRGWGG